MMLAAVLEEVSQLVLHLFLRELGSRDCCPMPLLRLGRCKAASRN